MSAVYVIGKDVLESVADQSCLAVPKTPLTSGTWTKYLIVCVWQIERSADQGFCASFTSPWAFSDAFSPMQPHVSEKSTMASNWQSYTASSLTAQIVVISIRTRLVTNLMRPVPVPTKVFLHIRDLALRSSKSRTRARENNPKRQLS